MYKTRVFFTYSDQHCHFTRYVFLTYIISQIFRLNARYVKKQICRRISRHRLVFANLETENKNTSVRRGSVILGRDIKCNSLSSALAVFVMLTVSCCDQRERESTSTTTELADSKAGVLDHQLTDDSIHQKVSHNRLS